MRTARDWRVYLVTDRDLSRGRPVEWVVEAAVRGGVTAVQLREKHCATRDFVQLACELKKRLAPLGVPLIVNDRVDVALAAGADGVHLGQEDMDCESARRLLGAGSIIGLSIDNAEQAREARTLDVDYLGVGPVFPTATKPDAAPALGLAGLAEVCAAARQVVVAIGGIGVENAGPVIQSGACGIAVVSAICSADDPERAAGQLRRLVDAGLGRDA